MTAPMPKRPYGRDDAAAALVEEVSTRGAALFLLWCLVCEPVPTVDNPLPFGSAAARGQWASEHTHGTGHNTWRVFDLPAEASHV